MKFSCDRSSLATVLTLVNNVIPTRTPKAVLQNLQIKPNNNNTITISGTDLEIGVAITLPVEDLKSPKSVLLNAHQLTGVITEEKSERVFFEVTKEVAKLTTERSSFEFAISDEEFPAIKKIDDDKVIVIKASDLQDAIERTKFAVAHNDGKYAFNGICISITKDEIDFVASDGNRLSLLTKKITNASKIEGLSIVITKGLIELARLANRDENINIQVTPSGIIATCGTARLMARLLEGKFPKYREVIPNDIKIKITANRQEMINGLRLLSKLCTEDSRGVHLDGVNNKLVMSVKAGVSGSGKIEIDAVITGGEVKTAYNCTYLLDMLNSFRGDEVTLKLKNNAKPMYIEEGDYLHIITPLNVYDE